jgi:alpha-maltose-1-phosphate synthase
MKVLVVIIAHPLRKLAGATIAGRQLSVATAEVADIDLAVMWDSDESFTAGTLKVRHMRAIHPLRVFERWLPRTFLVPLYGSKIPDLIEQGDYDIVHIHNLLPAFAAESVARACRKRGVPYVISSHGFNEQSRYASLNGFTGAKRALAAWAIERPFRRVVRGAAAIFALSDRDSELLSELGVPEEKVHIVSNGVSEFYLEEPAPAELETVRAKFGLGPDPILLFMGSLHGYKGLDVFLKCLGSVRQPVQPVVAGQFRVEHERQELLQRSGLPQSIARSIVFTNAVSNSDLRALYHSADLFVYPTKGDTLPLVVLEAMACGLPIVSTTVGGIPYMVGPDQGILVSPDDPDAVAGAVNALLADPGRREAMAKSARENVRARFRWAAAANKAVDGYRAVLEQSRELENVPEAARQVSRM